ncbi:hypothetical protein B2A_13418 [mine drainage metagenome]|uniref:Uncharacterized protein n=1 Tax=mine drainage metagenome TaxID=410659 RepID=T0YIC8_9ZZZZ
MFHLVPKEERVQYFQKHIVMYDADDEMVGKSIENGLKYGIPRKILEDLIVKRDTLSSYPEVHDPDRTVHITIE